MEQAIPGGKIQQFQSRFLYLSPTDPEARKAEASGSGTFIDSVIPPHDPPPRGVSFPLAYSYDGESPTRVPAAILVTPRKPVMAGLKSSEIHWVVHSYIGVEGGYLGDFSYRSHQDFYPGYCDLDVDLGSIDGNTTREKFIAVLTHSEPLAQAAILRGVAKRFPGLRRIRTPAAFQQLSDLAKRCVDGAALMLPRQLFQAQWSNTL